MNVRNALLVGGQKRCWDPLLKYLAQCDVQVYDVWHEEKALRKHIPGNVDLVIVIASLVSHALQNHAKSQASDMGIPVNYVSHNASVFPDQLKKWGVVPVEAPQAIVEEGFLEEAERTGPAFPIEQFKEQAPRRIMMPSATPKVEVPVVEAVPPEEEKESMPKEKKLRKNQVRAQAKIEHITELLEKDPAMPPNEIIDALIAKFPGSDSKPGGIAKSVIADIRWKKYGLRFGPGGRIFDKKGVRVSNLEKPRTGKGKTAKRAAAPAVTNGNGHHIEEIETEPVAEGVAAPRKVGRPPKSAAQVAGSLQSITELLSQLRTQMKKQGINDVFVPIEGSVRVRRSVETQLDI